MARKSATASPQLMRASNILRESALHLAQLQLQLMERGKPPTPAQRREYQHRMALLETAACDFAALQPRDTAASVKATKQIRLVLDSAERHGEDGDPEHEVGDLQDFIRTLAAIAGPDAVAAAVHRHVEDHEVA